MPATPPAAATAAWQALRPLSTLPSLHQWHFSPSPSPYRPPWRRHLASIAPGELSLTPAVEARLQGICDRHEQLVAQLGGPEASDLGHADISRLNKELAELEPVVGAVAELRARRKEVRRALAAGRS